MRRTVQLLLVLLCLLALAPGAHAATPGVNVSGIPGGADLDQAAASGAKYVRVFALRSYFDNGDGSLKTSPTNDFKNIVQGANARGMSPVFVLTGAPDGSTTPPSPASFATFAHNFAAAMASAGAVAAYEVWNEEDETQFWRGTPSPAQYAAILKAAYPALKSGDPKAKVLLGPLTGNNYAFLQALYDNGAQGSFDAASVHTDTACLVDPPSSFYREDGKVARFTFLGFRSVHDVMAANGDGDKPIWMTELGWTTTTSTCTRGMWAGKKAAGVTEPQQAANLREAFHCLADYPYMEAGLWFTLKDLSTGTDELDHYGLQRLDGSHKSSWDAFHSVATQGDTLTGPCGDFDPPDIKISQPTDRAQYIEALRLQATATDATQVARMTFQADGKEIRNFTGADVGSGKMVTLDWQGSKALSYGPHTITVIALDPQGNTSTQSVTVQHVKTLTATLKTTIKLGRVKLRTGRKASISGRVLKNGASLGLAGKVKVAWQQKRGKQWKTIHGGLKPAKKPFAFRQKLKSAGAWRVQVTYLGVAPYKKSSATSPAFRAR